MVFFNRMRLFSYIYTFSFTTMSVEIIHTQIRETLDLIDEALSLAPPCAARTVAERIYKDISNYNALVASSLVAYYKHGETQPYFGMIAFANTVGYINSCRRHIASIGIEIPPMPFEATPAHEEPVPEPAPHEPKIYQPEPRRRPASPVLQHVEYFQKHIARLQGIHSIPTKILAHISAKCANCRTPQNVRDALRHTRFAKHSNDAVAILAHTTDTLAPTLEADEKVEIMRLFHRFRYEYKKLYQRRSVPYRYLLYQLLLNVVVDNERLGRLILGIAMPSQKTILKLDNIYIEVAEHCEELPLLPGRYTDYSCNRE